VVVVRGREIDDADQATLPVIVGTDGSPTRTAVMSWAFEAAAERKVPLIAGEVSGLLLGSVSHVLLHQAECPVAIVRPDGLGGM
jgi:hypothetical protein